MTPRSTAVMAQMTWKNVEIKPVMKEVDPPNNSPSLQADFKINGIWEAERTAFFENRIVGAYTISYATRDWQTISRHHALQKHKYDHSV